MRPTKTILCGALFLAGSLAASTSLADTANGVTDDQITLGTLQDLSGPLAKYSQEALNGMLMAIDEVNEAGGIHGRELALEVADHGYQPQRAVLAARRMIQREHIFAMIQEMGSVTTMATLPILKQHNVLSLFPLSGDASTYLPRGPLKWSTSPPYAVGIRVGLRYLIDQHDYKTVCVTYQNDEYGSEVLRGVTEMLPYKGVELALKVSFPRGTTNFTSNVAKLKAADCDLVVIGAALREPVAIMKTARKLGWSPTFLGNSGTFSRRLPELGGEVTNGLYAPGLIHMPYTDGAASKALEAWARAYQERFDLEPDVFAAYGYMSIKLFARIAEDAGKQLTVDSFVKAIKQTRFEDTLFGATFQFGPNQHEGLSTVFLSRIVDGQWQAVTEAMEIQRRWPLGSEYAP